MSLCVKKPTKWVPTRSNTNQPVQSQKQARSLRFVFKKKNDCTIRVAETKGLISFAKLICPFASAQAFCWFSHAVAQYYYCIFLFIELYIIDRSRTMQSSGSTVLRKLSGEHLHNKTTEELCPCSSVELKLSFQSVFSYLLG